MEIFIVPLIAFICYLLSEFWKLIFKKKSERYAYIPFIAALLGGVMGVIIYFIDASVIPLADNVWIALEIGMVSGLSSTGANQFLKQYQKIKENEIQSKN